MSVRWLVIVTACAAVCPGITAAAHAQPPDVDPDCVGFESCDGWFTSNVTLRWVISGGEPITEGCAEIVIRVDTPSAGTPRDCTARQTVSPFDVETSRVTIFRDTTPPTITEAIPDRPPDHAGWYTHPVNFTVTGSDASSGVADCDAPTYRGPDTADAAVVATCRDVAGHSASRPFPLRYDSTPPDPSAAAVKTGDRVVRLSWPAGATATVMRTPGTDGESSSVLYQGAGTGLADREVRNGRQYRYVLTLTDEAGNAASRELAAMPQRQLLMPAKRALLGAPPMLRWTAVRGARYYNVQLFRGGRKILSRWPKRPQYQLKEKWWFRGRRYKLVDGRYKWYAWPGVGARSANRYGKRIGGRSFVLDRTPGAARRP